MMICESGADVSRGGSALDVSVILGEENGNGGTWKSLDNQSLASPLPGVKPGTPSSTRKGLQNRLGENNCFLNSIVQVLWRLDPFRKSFLLVSGHACTEKSCIFCSLKVVFTQFQFSDHSTLPPDSLRRALAMAFAKRSRFQMGLMDDATECFEIILRWLHFHLVYNETFDKCNAPHCISHVKFGMNITEQAFCILCGTKTRPSTFTELVHYVPTSAIARQQSRTSVNGNQTCFGRLLRGAVDTEGGGGGGGGGGGQSCPSGCGEGLQMSQVLMNSPDVLTIGLVWDSDNATPNDIAQLVVAIDSTIRPSDLFQSSLSVEFRLVGIVCYYRKHYSTFLYDQHENVWNLYDDATIVQVGTSWSVIAAKICVGRFQPLLLFYENPESEPVSMATAPKRTQFVDVPADFSSFSHGDSLTDLSLSMKRCHVADNYEGGNPSVAQQRRSFSSNFEEVNTSQENSSSPLKSVPITVTHHSSKDSSVSEHCDLNCSSKVKVQSTIVTNSDLRPEKSDSDVTRDKDNNRKPWTTVSRSGQEDCPIPFQESRPGHHVFSGHLGSPCTTASSATSLSCGIQADSLKKTESITVNGNTESDFYERNTFLPSSRNNSSTHMFFGDGSDFSQPTNMFRNKRSSFACSSQNAFTALDELSCYSSDDQFLSLGSRSNAGRFPSSQRLVPRWSNGSTPFGLTRSSKNSQLMVDDISDTQGSYINPETVLTVLRSRGLKLNSLKLRPHSSLGFFGRRQDNANLSAHSKSPNEEVKNLSVKLEVTHVTSDGNVDNCNNSSKISNTATTPPSSCSSSNPKERNPCLPATTPHHTDHAETKRQQKGILMKRRHKKKKRVSFSDNVALVLCADDDDVTRTEPKNYADYVRKIATTQSHNLRSSSLSSTSSSDSAYSSSSDSTSTASTTSPIPDLPLGSLVDGMSSVEESGVREEDDDLDSEDDDACIPEEDFDGNASSDKIRCNLCCRKWIAMPDTYCRDCNIYLNRLQHRI